MMPSSGRPTPVDTKPSSAGQKVWPLSRPSAEGKMRLPAPKKMANSMKPMTKVFLFTVMKDG